MKRMPPILNIRASPADQCPNCQKKNVYAYKVEPDPPAERLALRRRHEGLVGNLAVSSNPVLVGNLRSEILVVQST